jgi:hypothetical protein
MGRIIPYIMENKKCLKPPTRYELVVNQITIQSPLNHICLLVASPLFKGQTPKPSVVLWADLQDLILPILEWGCPPGSSLNKNKWLVVDLPLWKIWVRQMGWWHSQGMESHKIHVPVTTNQVLIDGGKRICRSLLSLILINLWNGMALTLRNSDEMY